MRYPAVLASVAIASAASASAATLPARSGADLCLEEDRPAGARALSPAELFSEHRVRARVAEVGDRLIGAAQAPVSAELAQQLIDQVSRCPGVELFDELRWWFAAHARSFAPAARARIDAYLHQQGPATLRADPIAGFARLTDEPAPPPEWGPIRWHRLDGALFRGSPSFGELLQGELGDCYFLSALSSVLERSPGFLARTFHEQPGGTLTGTFYAHARWNDPLVPVQVAVDELLPMRGGALLGCSDRAPRVLWPALLEKLWASFKGGYSFVSGGSPADALAALTGSPASVQPIFRDSAPDAIFAFIREHELRGDAMTAGTYGVDAHGHADPAVAYASSWLARGHSYSLLGTRTEGASRFVRLRNPWGYLEADGRGRRDLPAGDDGIFEVPLAELIAQFAEIAAAPIPASPPSQKAAQTEAR